jgi:uncharacterized protein YqjF (DUF2071 family)
MNTIDEILQSTACRQYPIPAKKWKYFQEWHNTIFLHWEVPVFFLEEHIPEGLKLDVFNNMAWISFVSFEVKNMRLRNLPSLPFISQFHEINIRTYVIKDNKPGIYLFSIETDKLIEVLLTRAFVGLPYQKAKIKSTPTRLLSKNKPQHQYVDITIGENRPLTEGKNALDFWLTERHALYENCGGAICRFDIHHKEWDLKNLNATINNIEYKAGKYSLSTFPDKMQYSEKIEVLLWSKEKSKGP